MRAVIERAEPSSTLRAAVSSSIPPGSVWFRVLRGYTTAERWIVSTDSERSYFVKVGTDNATAEWLRAESRVYKALDEPWLAQVVDWIDEGDESPILILENLHGASWPPAWDDATIDAVRETLAAIHATEPPHGLPAITAGDRRTLAGWTDVAADPEALFAARIIDKRWFNRAVGELIDLSAKAVMEGDRFVHMDVRSDNLCLVSGQVKLLDWNWAAIGNPTFDLCAWLPSLEAEGGPQPETIVDGEPELAALLAGYFCAEISKPDPNPSSGRRAMQVRQAKSAVPWVARLLGIEPPLALPAEKP